MVVPSYSIDAFAKKSKTSNPRLKYLRGEDKDMFEALTKKQRKSIANQKVEVGFNSWMIRLAVGEPYYSSEHHPVYKDFEEVWLYTKPKVETSKSQNKIVDPNTNWITRHTVTTTKTCTIGDYFLLFDRGVVDKISKDRSGKTYGSCTVETQEEFVPLKPNR